MVGQTVDAGEFPVDGRGEDEGIQAVPELHQFGDLLGVALR